MKDFNSRIAEMIRGVGEALYGRDFQVPLAAELQVSPNTIRRWVAGEAPVPTHAFSILQLRLWTRAAALDELADELEVVDLLSAAA